MVLQEPEKSLQRNWQKQEWVTKISFLKKGEVNSK